MQSTSTPPETNVHLVEQIEFVTDVIMPICGVVALGLALGGTPVNGAAIALSLSLLACFFVSKELRVRGKIRAGYWLLSGTLTVLPVLSVAFLGTADYHLPSLATLGVIVAAFLLSERASAILAFFSLLVYVAVLIGSPSSGWNIVGDLVHFVILIGGAVIFSAIAVGNLRDTLAWASEAIRKAERRETILRATQEDLQRSLVEQARLNSALQVATIAAEDANRLKTQFLANMSHELRTPLNAIMNFTRFMSKERYGPLTERQQELQQRVLFNADHLLGLINDILDLAKIEAGHMDVVREPTELTPLLHGVMSTAVGLTKDKGLVLETAIDDGLPLVAIDKTRVRQVLLNLLSNAAKFTDTGSIRLSAKAGAGFVTIAVHDTGIGIPFDQQHLIFEEFRQVQGDLSRNYQGTGLGLPISRRLVEMHGGTMWLESQPGQGSTFSFTVPTLATPVDLPAPEVRLDGNDTLIVVVDDDPEAQRILHEYLHGASYAVQVVSDSREAATVIREMQPQLVLLDVFMPHLDGWEVLAELREHPATANIPVVMCSIVEQQRLGSSLGANDYLVKPVREDALHTLLGRWVHPAATVLVIDDEADARQIVRTLLEESGHKVLEAADGSTGLELLGQQKIQLVILDLMMPGMDGFDVLAQIRATSASVDLPVLVLSAKDLTPDERRWLADRTQAQLHKGADAAVDLRTHIQRIAARWRLYEDRPA
jgi:signal transduction histidine kinase/DNA-binding response OmpR family regulator